MITYFTYEWATNQSLSIIFKTIVSIIGIIACLWTMRLVIKENVDVD